MKRSKRKIQNGGEIGSFLDDRSFGMAHTDDQWVRLFNVSDPRRAYAGHTLYKVTSKVFQREFPEGATEIAVWRRFTDFKKLHQELLKIYLFKDLKEEQFPPFPKAKFFGRFEEGVIEERRTAALELLNFAGNTPDLFTSQPFVKFFEGGFPDSPIRSDSVASRESSLSDAESESPPPTAVSVQDETHNSSIRIERQSPSPPCTSGKENGDNLDEASLGGVWLYKQPSLTEGLDNLSSDEESNECQEPSESALSTAENESKPNNLTGEPNEEFMVKTEEDQDEVFMDEAVECSESDSLITEREKRDSNTQPPNWLVRAISICSEGEDLEALASEADSEELSFPQAFSDYSSCSGEERTKESESLEKVHENQFHDNSRSYLSADSYHTLNVHDNDDTENLPTECSLSCDRGQDDHHGIETGLDKASHMINPPAKPESSNSSSGTGAYSDKDSHSLKDNASVGTADKQSFTSSSDSGRAATQRRPIYDLGNIFIDCKESDYLYMAGHTIHKALDCEVSGRYEEAFSLYKTCVSLLLSGVQEEKDVKRREAVRRKTAQYLLKAEALYNAYLTNNESQDEKPEQESSSSHPSNSICDTDDQHKFKDLTLADLKVMGIVGKVMLVENSHNGDTYVLKALCKSGSVRPPGHSHGNERRRKKSVRRLYGKYPNIVQLFRYFETGSSIYLLLEYARGGRLWDHIACYRSSQESQATGNAREQNRLGLKKTTHDQCDKNEKNDAVNVKRTSYQEAGKDLAVDRVPENITNSNAKSSCSGQASEDSTRTSNASLVQPELSTKTNGPTSPYNGNNNELSVTKEESKGDKDLVKTCTEKAEADASRDNKHLLFLKLDEYFASSSQRLPDEHLKIWAAEIVLAVAYLHTSGIICRDLHPKNVLLDEEGHVLLTYFGSWEETEHVPDEEAVNHFYCAPEVWQIDEITVAADWWSVGALLYELITGQALSTAHPWGIQTHTELQLPIKISPEAKSLLRELLRVAPSERLGSGVNGVEEIKSHPFFNGVNWTWLCSRIS